MAFKKNILLVDDDQIFIMIHKRLLENAGLASHIQVAMNGRDALSLLHTYLDESTPLPDVILLDLSMPVMDGFGFLEAFQRMTMPRKEDINVVIVTSSRNDIDLLRASDLGATHFLTKPVSEAVLIETLSQLSASPNSAS